MLGIIGRPTIADNSQLNVLRSSLKLLGGTLTDQL